MKFPAREREQVRDLDVVGHAYASRAPMRKVSVEAKFQASAEVRRQPLCTSTPKSPSSWGTS